MTRVTTGHNGSQRVTNLAKTYMNTVSQGHKARHKSQMLMAGLAHEPRGPGLIKRKHTPTPTYSPH